jgi:hypothetical protein
VDVVVTEAGGGTAPSSISIPQEVAAALRAECFALASASTFGLSTELEAAQRFFFAEWDDLEPDGYLRAGAKFRRRRLARFSLDPAADKVSALPADAYFQSEDLNRYAGGVARRFAPFSPATLANEYLHALIKAFFRQLPIEPERLAHPWLVDVHQIRIIATDEEQGEPAPEGPHHDGEEFGVVQLIGRRNASGGVSSVYTNDGESISSFTLRDSLDALLWWDPHVMHGVSPIRPEEPGTPAIRDTLVLGYDPQPLPEQLS